MKGRSVAYGTGLRKCGGGVPNRLKTERKELAEKRKKGARRRSRVGERTTRGKGLPRKGRQELPAFPSRFPLKVKIYGYIWKF